MNDKRPTMRLLYGAPTIRHETSDDQNERKPDPGAIKRPGRPGRKPYPENLGEEEIDTRMCEDYGGPRIPEGPKGTGEYPDNEPGTGAGEARRTERVYAGPDFWRNGESSAQEPEMKLLYDAPKPRVGARKLYIKARRAETVAVYAAPGFFNRRRAKLEADMEEVYAGPEFFERGQDGDETEINDVYGGPEFFKEEDPDRTPIEAVYAGPDYFGEESGTDPTPIAPVYAGPEFFGIGDKDKEKAAFEGVYAGPEPQQPSMMLVYAGPEYFANRPIGGPADFPAPDVRFCPRCGAMNKQNAKFCTECGTVLQPEEPQPEPEAKRFYCHECGAAVAEDMPACPCCGAKRDVPGETKVFEAVREPEKPAAPVKRSLFKRLFTKKTGIDREEK